MVFQSSVFSVLIWFRCMTGFPCLLRSGIETESNIYDTIKIAAQDPSIIRQLPRYYCKILVNFGPVFFLMIVMIV